MDIGSDWNRTRGFILKELTQHRKRALSGRNIICSDSWVVHDCRRIRINEFAGDIRIISANKGEFYDWLSCGTRSRGRTLEEIKGKIIGRWFKTFEYRQLKADLEKRLKSDREWHIRDAKVDFEKRFEEC